ncbi:MAG: Na+/H+ antiporter subunit B [Planctomycetes bacterium]|nr:Na+/H+ antiporter subunit B [Planctomycetota bacterium]
MSSLILRTAARHLLPLLVLYSVFLLVQGHNHPGGGFIGGLIAAAAIGLYALAYDVAEARRILPAAPHYLIAAGLLAAAGSGVWGLMRGKPFLESGWLQTQWPAGVPLELGTPLLFDAGVYLVVIGVAVTILFTLAEED